MILVQTALPFEAKPIISELSLQKVSSPGKGRFFRNSDATFGLLITGIGEFSVSTTIQSFFSSNNGKEVSTSKLINIGIAGATNTEIKFGQLFQISEVQHLKNKPIPLNPLNLTGIESKQLLTVDEACSDITQLDLKNDEQPLIDMEAYHLISVLLTNDILPLQNIHSVKVASDYADGKKIDMKKLAQVYDSTIKQLLGELITKN